jgi:signal transduction histidine kinase/CheY-like chemotaxis protein
MGDSPSSHWAPSATRLQVEQLRLTCKQAARFPLPVTVVDAILAWLVWREGMAGIAVAWFLVRLALQGVTDWRVRVLQRRLDAGPSTPAAWAHEQGVLVLLFGMMGVSRAVLVPLLFTHGPGESQYIFTMLCVGLAAAGVGNVGGQVRVYMAFALPLGGAISLGWLSQGGQVPVTVGLLPLAAVALLASFVREQARSLQQIFALVEEREQLVLGLQQQHQLAQEALAAKSRFIASASHDLRQPVTAIGLLIGLLADATPQSRSQELLGRLAMAVGALEHLLRGLLDLSRLDSGTVTPAVAPTSLQALYTRLEAQAGQAARAKGLRLRWRGGALCVRSDPVLLQQMLQNLIDNALRYTERGGILVSARRRGPATVRLEVRDTGCGIAAEHQRQVFDEFVQIGNARRDGHHGLGLGLAIVKRNAELLGHRLTLISHAGRGSCFAIELTLDAGAPASAAAAHGLASEAPRSGPLSLDGMVLWLLEDDASVRVALAARLSAWGAQVVPFGLLSELQAALRRALPAPHGLLTDHRLPDGTGLEAIDAVRTQHGRVPALVLTGDTGTEELMRFKTRGAPVVHKPFDQDELLAHVAAWKQPAW